MKNPTLPTLNIDLNSRAELAMMHAENSPSTSTEAGLIFGVVGPWNVIETEEGYEWQLSPKLSAIDQARFRTTLKSIPSKEDGNLRVILIGESAAASFGYWGEFNLASAIQGQLGSRDPNVKIEVIDLAAVNATWHECNDILNHSFTLEPDAIIFYVGNNEAKCLLEYLEKGGTSVDLEHFRARWSIYSDDAASSCGEKIADALAAHCIHLLNETSKLCKAFDVPLMYVLPGSNLLDWMPQEQVPWAASESDLANWSQSVQDALKKDMEAPIPSGCQLHIWSKARNLVAQGYKSEGMSALFDMGTCGLGSFVNGVPQLINSVANRLLELCGELSIPCYDMRERFTPAHNLLPSREYYIDYCHLSELGISTVAPEIAEMAAQLLRLKDLKCCTYKSCPASPLERFQGAIVGMAHNYHYGQPGGVVGYWVAQAIGSQWEGATSYLVTLRSILTKRVREHLTRRRLEELGLTNADWDVRFNLYITKFIYHARFDIALARIIDEECMRVGVNSWIAPENDARLSLDGSLYSLYYLDHLKGFRPLSRAANRGGWERPELAIIIDRPVAVVEFPILDYEIVHVEVTLEMFEGFPISISLNDTLLGVIEGRQGVQSHILQVAGHSCPPKWDTNTLRLEPQRLVGIRTLPSVSERYLWSLRYGIYPNCGRLMNLKLGLLKFDTIPPVF